MNLGARNQNFHVLNEEEVEIETNTGMLMKNSAVFNGKEIFNIKWNSKFEIWNSKLSLHWHASWEHGCVGHLVSSISPKSDGHVHGCVCECVYLVAQSGVTRPSTRVVHAHVDFWLEFSLSFERHLGTHMLMCLTVCSAVKYINHSHTHLNPTNHENAILSTPDVEN